jgi:hypothetical protein
LLASDGPRTLAEALDTEQLAPDGAGKQILARGLPAGDEAGKEAVPAERKDRGDLWWETGGWNGGGNLIAADRSSPPRVADASASRCKAAPAR